MLYCGTVTYSIECEAVGLFLFGECITAVLYADVFEYTGVVVGVVSSV